MIAAGAPALLLWDHSTVGAVAHIVGIAVAVLIGVAVLAAAAGPTAGHEDRTVST